MLLRGLEEAGQATRPALAAEMTLVRIAYAAELPSPADAIRAIGTGAAPAAEKPQEAAAPATSDAPATPAPAPGGSAVARARAEPAAEPAREAPPAPDPAPAPTAEAARRPHVASLDDIAALAEERREPILGAWLRTEVRPVRVAAGTLEINCVRAPDRKMLALLQEKLEEWTGERWMIALSEDGGAPTLDEREKAAQAAADKAALEHPLVRRVLDAFPGAQVRAVHRPAREPAPGDANDGDQPS